MTDDNFEIRLIWFLIFGEYYKFGLIDLITSVVASTMNAQRRESILYSWWLKYCARQLSFYERTERRTSRISFVGKLIPRIKPNENDIVVVIRPEFVLIENQCTQTHLQGAEEGLGVDTK